MQWFKKQQCFRQVLPTFQAFLGITSINFSKKCNCLIVHTVYFTLLNNYLSKPDSFFYYFPYFVLLIRIVTYVKHFLIWSFYFTLVGHSWKDQLIRVFQRKRNYFLFVVFMNNFKNRFI